MTTKHLQNFCAFRHQCDALNAPFSVGEYTYATDRRIAVRVPRIESVEEVAFPANIASVFQVAHEDLPVALPVTKCDWCGDGAALCAHCGHEGPCKRCDGKGYIGAMGIDVLVGAQTFAARYIQLVARLPGLQFYNSTAINGPAWFTFTGGEGVLMPLSSK